jgi:hypothetical protein
VPAQTGDWLEPGPFGPLGLRLLSESAAPRNPRGAPNLSRHDLQPTGSSRQALDVRDVWIVGAILFVAVALPILVGAAAGTLEIPRNDDWSYRGIASRLFATGRFELDGAAQTIVLGQILLTQPLLWLSGGAPWAFLAVGILAAGFAAVGGYLLVRRFLDRRSALLAIGALILFPGYLAYDISYMSDVPALACQFGCLGLASVAVGRHPISSRWLVAALAVGLLGFTIREFALAAPAALVGVLIVREPRRLRTWLVAVGVAVLCLGILASRSLLAGQLGSVPWELKPLRLLLPPVVTVSFVLVPVALVAALRWHRLWHTRDVLAGLLLSELVVIPVVLYGPFPHVMVFGLITQWGAPNPYYLMGDRPELFSDVAWSAIAVLALAATSLVAGVTAGVVGSHLRRARRRPEVVRDRLGSPLGLLGIFVLLVAAGLAGFGLVGSFYDRYLWPVIPALAALLLYVPHDLLVEPEARAAMAPFDAFVRRGRATAGTKFATVLGLCLLAAMAAAFMLNSNAYDGARWMAGESLVARGFDAASTDAGPEWVNSHQTGVAAVTRPVDAVMWYQRYWPDLRLCAFVADSPPPVEGKSLIRIDPVAYELFLFLGPAEPFYYYRVPSAGCP